MKRWCISRMRDYEGDGSISQKLTLYPCSFRSWTKPGASWCFAQMAAADLTAIQADPDIYILPDATMDASVGSIPSAVEGVPGVSTGTIEADVLLKDGTFIDMKHSRMADPYITAQQVENLKNVLNAQPRRIQRAWFVTNGPVDEGVLQKIREANDFLGEELIRVIDDVGDYP